MLLIRRQGVHSRRKPLHVKGFGLAENGQFGENLGEGYFETGYYEVVTLLRGSNLEPTPDTLIASWDQTAS